MSLSASQITPTRGKILIKVDEKKKQSGMIIIPESARKSEQWATVLKVGQGAYIEGTDVIMKPVTKPGDRVMIGKHGGSWVNEEERLNLIDEEDVWLKAD